MYIKPREQTRASEQKAFQLEIPFENWCHSIYVKSSEGLRLLDVYDGYITLPFICIIICLNSIRRYYYLLHNSSKVRRDNQNVRRHLICNKYFLQYHHHNYVCMSLAWKSPSIQAHTVERWKDKVSLKIHKQGEKNYSIILHFFLSYELHCDFLKKNSEKGFTITLQRQKIEEALRTGAVAAALT